jgi:hypothetical protein
VRILKNVTTFGSILALAVFFLIVILKGFGPKVGSTFSTISNCLEPCPPLIAPTSIIVPTPPIHPPVTGGGGGQLEIIDSILNETISASIAYHAPTEAQIGETFLVELLLNPSLSEKQLVDQITDPSTFVTFATVEITPQMKAEIVSPVQEALSILPLHDNPVQLISGTATTRWSWYVTPHERGDQKLTIIIYRFVRYNDEDYWREIKTYESNLNVRVTLASLIQTLDWKWIIGGIASAILIPGFWRWFDKRKNNQEQQKPVRRIPYIAPNSQLNKQPTINNLEKEFSGQIFLSYRRSDSADITGRIFDRLVEHYGRDPVFKDVYSIPLGVDFKEYIDQKVGECSVLLAVIGKRWADVRDAAGQRRLDDPDDFVRIEIESALERGIPVIPLLVGDAKMVSEKDLPPSLRKLSYRNGISIRSDPDFHHDMDRLIASLEQHVR